VIAGARADLVRMSADPRAGVDSLTHPAGVMVRGRWASRAELDAVLVAHRIASHRPHRPAGRPPSRPARPPGAAEPDAVS
jgi:hypothetical protein